jgi:hypothetical protein
MLVQFVSRDGFVSHVTGLSKFESQKVRILVLAITES